MVGEYCTYVKTLTGGLDQVNVNLEKGFDRSLHGVSTAWPQKLHGNLVRCRLDLWPVEPSPKMANQAGFGRYAVGPSKLQNTARERLPGGGSL